MPYQRRPGQGDASLTYHVGDVPEHFDLAQAEVETAIEKALDAWSEVVDVEFSPTAAARQPNSIDIRFAPIDGVGGILAQAYLPDDVNRGPMAGDIRIDVKEPWEVGNDQGRRAFDFSLVMMHEIGHSLGVDHIDAFGSVMFPRVSPNQSFSVLSSEDVDAALALYAANESGSDDPVEADPNDDSNTDPVDEQPTETERPHWRERWQRWRRWFRIWRQRFAHDHVHTLRQFSDDYHNHGDSNDVNGDKQVSAIDALMIINELNGGGSRQLFVPEGEEAGSFAKIDTNADGFLSAIDALNVINQLSDEASGEAEPTSDEPNDQSETEDDVLIDDPLVEDEPTDEQPELDTEIDPNDDDVDPAPVDDESPQEEPEEEGSVDEDPVNDVPPVDDESDGPVDEAPDEEGDSEDDMVDIDDGPIDDESCTELFVDMIFDRVDENGDGVISQDEVPEGVWDHLVEFTGDENGEITPEEVTAAIEDRFEEAADKWRNHHHHPRLNRLFNRVDANEDEFISEDEVPQRLWERLSQADANEDGQVSMEELHAFRHQHNHRHGRD